MDQDWNQTGFWLGAKENLSRLSLNSGAGRHVQPYRVFLEAARSSGLDQDQVSEDRTTVWHCLHVESNPASGKVIVDILFYVHHDTLTAK